MEMNHFRNMTLDKNLVIVWPGVLETVPDSNLHLDVCVACNWILRPNEGSTGSVAIYIQLYVVFSGGCCLNVGLVGKEIVGGDFLMSHRSL